MKKTHFGMWLFLASEIMLFAAFFLAYFVYRYWYPEAFKSASHHLNGHLGLLNTALLLTSSWLMALAVVQPKRRALLVCGTMIFGFMFLGIKFYEYHHKWSESLLPGFTSALKLAPAEKIFMSLYVFGTGLHALHMLAGLGALALLATLMFLKKLKDDEAIVRMGLYWHFVDIVWLFLYPLLYLIGRP